VQLLDLPLRQALLKLALPLTASMALETAFTFVNGYWVGRLGTEALAAANLCSFSLWMMMALTATISTGGNAVMAQRIGARQPERARQLAWICVLAALLWGGGLALLAQTFSRDYLSWQVGGASRLTAVVELATVYLTRVFWFAPIFCANEVLSAIMRAHGDTLTPLRVYALGVALNFVLDPVLMFHFDLGLPGAAYASGISFAVMLVLLAGLVRRRFPPVWLGTPPWGELAEVFRIGLPGALTAAFFCFIYILITPTVGLYGPTALAALGIGHRVESFSYLISHGLSLASITLVGQHLGAGQKEQAYQAGLEACRVVTAFMLLASLVMLLGADPLARFFSDDPAVIDRTIVYLRWMALAQWGTGLAMVLEGVMSGAGRPLASTMVSATCAASRWPLSGQGSQAYGLVGVWAALVAARWVEACLCLLVFWRSPVWKGVGRSRGVDP